MSETNPNTRDPSVGVLLLCIPIGLAIWLIPLYWAAVIGILKASAIIFVIMVVLILISKMCDRDHSDTDTPRHNKEQKTYTV